MVDINPSTDISEFQETERPPSEQLVELHLYLVPKDKWLEKRKLAKNQAVDHTISVGFVRVLPQTVLSDLRKEMHRQLGIDSVPQTFVFLRSVGRNFTQVRPKQEMEMKVKNYMPPFAPEPELFLKEGQYTGPNNWSQGEDSGLEESVGDSNSQRSHDRATPESLNDDPLILPKLTDYLGVPLHSDESSRSQMPPGAMTVSMSTDDIPTASSLAAYRTRKGDPETGTGHLVRPVRPDRKSYGSSDDVRYTRIRENTTFEKVLAGTKEGMSEHRTRGGSWNRRQKRGSSKERGGTQLPTWAETRTTRLRRSKALGETNNNVQNVGSKPKRTTKRNESSPNRVPRQQTMDAEDEADVEDEAGKVLMERIRANSRCLKAQLSSHHSRRSGYQDTSTVARERVLNGHRNGRAHNGVYTMHTRRNQRIESERSANVESTTIKLLDNKGQEVDATSTDQTQATESSDEPEIVHMHKLSVDGEDARTVDMTGSGRAESGAAGLLANISEGTGESAESNNPPVIKEPVVTETIDSDDKDSKDESKGTTENEQSEDSTTANEVYNANELAEGRLINQNGQLTIEVEVKELGSSEDSSDTPIPVVSSQESNATPLTSDNAEEYDSYRVYSEQNLQATSVDHTSDTYGRRSNRSDLPKDDSIRMKARQSRGVYLRRLEHRNSQSTINKAHEQGMDNRNSSIRGSPSRRYGGRSISHNRKSGKNRLEKWSSTAASTGDLREAAWDYSNDKERLLVILNEVRSETRLRQKQREELLRRIKQLQSRAHQRREQGETNHCLRSLPKFAGRADSAEVREMWRKRYLEAKKITPRLEEECSRLRQELEKLHRELLAKVQAGVWALLTISGKTERPSNKLSYKIMIARLLQEIEDLTRRVEGTRLKLHTEVKLRSMAEKDVRNLREELLKKKIQVTLTRNQEQAAMGNGLRQQYFISAV